APVVEKRVGGDEEDVGPLARKGCEGRASVGLTSTATRAAAGSSSRRSPNRFAANSAEKKLIPVMFPPGRLSVATRPSFTGSEAVAKTIGIVVVAALAASVAGVPPVAITATLRRTNSATSSGNRSY